MTATARILVTGVPKGGKTTLAKKLATVSGVAVLSSNDLARMGWSEAAEEVARWLDEPGPWIIEGAEVGRALKKWFRAHPKGRPADRVFWLGRARERLSDGEQRLALNCETTWKECTTELLLRGVPIIY